MSDGWDGTSVSWIKEKFWFVRGHWSSWHISSCLFHIKHCHSCKKWHFSVVSMPPTLQVMDNSPDLSLHVLCSMTCYRKWIFLCFSSGFWTKTEKYFIWVMDHWLFQQSCWCHRFAELQKHHVPCLLNLPDDQCRKSKESSFVPFPNVGDLKENQRKAKKRSH